MHAIQIHEHGGPEKLTLETVPDPEPATGQVVVAARAVGVNPVDTYIRSGDQGYQLSDFPHVLGADAAGVVDAVGDGVRGIAPGDRVYCAGTIGGAYAENVLCEASQVHPLPEHVTFEAGACIGIPYATAYRALHHKAQARPGETVLVHGASGGVGLAAVQLARALGATVIGTAGSAEGRQLAQEQGAHHVLDHHAPRHMDEAAALGNGEGLDVILDMLTNVNLDTDLKHVAPHGRIVVIGSRGTIEITPRDAMTRDASILGMSLRNASAAERAEIHAALGAGLENETLRPVVDQTFALADASSAHRAVMEGPTRGNIVLIP